MKTFKVKDTKMLNVKSIIKYKPINVILYDWHKKMRSLGIYVTESILKEEAINIKATSVKPKLEEFKASNG